MSLLLLSKRRYSRKVLTTAPASLLAYWPLSEPSGTVVKDYSGHGYNGTYTGVDLAQPGIGDGKSCPLYDGVNDYSNIAVIRNVISYTEFTISLWVKVSSAGVWTDGVSRWALGLFVDANNRIDIRRTVVNNTLTIAYTAGAVAKSFSPTTFALTSWLHIAMTVSVNADQFKAYVNNSLQGTATGLGVWAGVSGATTSAFGAVNITPTNAWSGNVAHVAIWNTPLTANQIANLARVV